MNSDVQRISKAIFRISDESEFNELALKVFGYQAEQCEIYAQFIRTLGVDRTSIDHYSKIPFLPISFFKSHKVYASPEKEEIVFTSSGTTGMEPSRHFVAKEDLYAESFLSAFRLFYGEPEEYCILGLLPGYLERSGSSLIYMVKELIRLSEHPDSGFYLYDHEKLNETLLKLEENKKKTLLIGVSFALLDFFEKYTFNLKHTSVLETGGMKGRKKEIIREELHHIICAATGLASVDSEYGMTELLSQAYSKGNGLFQCPPWMKILIRETTDPLNAAPDGQTGGINVIDLANVYSCSFIATQDLGRINGKNIEIMGRFDNSDIRGCSLMV